MRWSVPSQITQHGHRLGGKLNVQHSRYVQRGRHSSSALHFAFICIDWEFVRLLHFTAVMNIAQITLRLALKLGIGKTYLRKATAACRGGHTLD